MSEKKTSGHLRHEEAMRLHTHLERLCHPDVKAGLEKVFEMSAQHHQQHDYSLEQRVIVKMLRDHVDDSVNRWLAQYDHPPLAFSRLLKEQGIHGAYYFEQLFEKFRAKLDWVVSIDHPDLAPTASSLITFGYFFQAHFSDNEEVVQFKTSSVPGKPSATSITVSRSKRRNTSTRNAKRDMRVQFDFSDGADRYCQLCQCLTERAIEVARIMRHPEEITLAEPRALELLATPGTRLYIKNFSNEYCSEHSPDQSNAAYRRAAARRVEYYATRRFMIMVRQAMRPLGLGHMTITRNTSFRIANECPDQALIKAIPRMLEAWFDQEEADCNDSPEDFLHEHMQRILSAFQQANHAFTDFVEAFANKHSRHFYDLAKKHGVISDLEEELAEIGFIKDAYQYVLENGGIILGSIQEEDEDIVDESDD